MIFHGVVCEENKKELKYVSAQAPPLQTPQLLVEAPNQGIADCNGLCIPDGGNGRCKDSSVTFASPEPCVAKLLASDTRPESFATSSNTTNKINDIQGQTEEVNQYQHILNTAWTEESAPQTGGLPIYVTAVQHSHEDHGPHEREPSIVSAIAAGIINWSLMFGLCCAFGMILFSDPWHEKHRALGVKMNLNTAMVLGFVLAGLSKIPVAIGGPDLTPMVFLGSFVATIAESIASQLQLDYPDASRRRLDLSGHDVERSLSDALLVAALGTRRLGGSSDQEFCYGHHLENNEELCHSYHEQLIPTIIAATSVSSLLLGVLFLSLGRFKMTRLVSFVPTSITEAFMSCIGYKVFKYALKFCKFEPRQFIPAACVGVPLYFVKAMHIGNPAIMIPLILGVPMACFYFYIYCIDGSDLDAARKDKLLFPVMENVEFWKVWEDSLFKLDKINGKALLKTGPDMAMMIVVTLLDCLLMLSYTESNLPVTVTKDYEIQLDGLGNIVTSFMGSPVGYMILKFNVLNYGVMGNVKDRRAGVIYAVLCGCGYFFSVELINYIPRFFLGILLFFAGAGFVAENLWGSRKYLSSHEWMQIVAILVVFIFTGELLYAVLVGGLLTGLDFIVRYARVPCTSGNPLRGGQLPSRERHGPVLQRNLHYIANSWLLIIKLKGYVFFASAEKLTQFIRSEMESQASVPEYRRLKFIAIDCQLLDGMDACATKAMKKIEKEAHALKIRILWTPESHVRDLKEILRLVSERDVFEDLDTVKTYVELLALDYRASIQKKWLKLHPAFMLAKEMMHARMAFEPFAHVFLVDAVRRGCPWQYCGVLSVKAFETVLWEPGQLNQDLFLIHSGEIGIFNEEDIGEDWENIDWENLKPVALYRHGWFLNRDVLIRAPTRDYAICYSDGEVLYWNERQWSRMAREVPFMASAISKMVMKQQVLDSDPMVVRFDEQKVFCEVCEEEELMNANVMSTTHTMLQRARSMKSTKSVKSMKSKISLATNTRTVKTQHTFQSDDSDAASKSTFGPCSVKNFVYKSGGQSSRAEDYSRCTGDHHDTEGRTSDHSAKSNASSERYSLDKESPQPNMAIHWGTPQMIDAPEPLACTSSEKSEESTKELEDLSPNTLPSRKRSRVQSLPSLFRLLPQLFHGTHSVDSVNSDNFSVAGAGRYVEDSSAAQRSIPEQLQHRLNGIQTAQVLDRYELYHSAATSQRSSLPRLPRTFQVDLVIAYSTYCKVDVDEGVYYMDAQNLPAAIMYAGIFNTLLKPLVHLPQRKLTLRDFLNVGHKAVMAALSVQQESKIDQFFEEYLLEFDKDRSGDFDRDELIDVFRRMFHPDISIEEVDGVTSAWLDDGHRDGNSKDDRIDRAKFREMMSHIVREHEQDWNLLCGLREIMGKHSIGNGDKLDASTMVQTSRVPLTKEEAEEMLWVADWRLNGRGDGRSLEFVDVVAAVLLDINMPLKAKLPPPPKIPTNNRNTSLQQSLSILLPDLALSLQVGQCVCGNIFKEDSVFCRRCGAKRPEEDTTKDDTKDNAEDDFAKLVVDLRDEAHDLRQLYVWAKCMAPPIGDGSTAIEDYRHFHKRIMEKHGGEIKKKHVHVPERHGSVIDTILLDQLQAYELWKLKIWCLMEEPHSSVPANLLSWFMGAMILASVFALVLEPLMDHDRPEKPQSEKDVWKAIELYFTVIFSLELLVRFIVADADLRSDEVVNQTRCQFLLGPSNICDFCAVLPYYVEVFYGTDDDKEFKLLRFARLMRLSRVMKLTRLSNRTEKKEKMFGPIAMVLTVIWGIYLKNIDE